MSSEPQQYFTSDDLKMLERVLDHAGIYNSANDGGRHLRLSAARFLIRLFQAGTADEHSLYIALTDLMVQKKLLSQSPLEVPLRSLATGASWIVGTPNGYRFGAQVMKRRPSFTDRLFGHNASYPVPAGRVATKALVTQDLDMQKSASEVWWRS